MATTTMAARTEDVRGTAGDARRSSKVLLGVLAAASVAMMAGMLLPLWRLWFVAWMLTSACVAVSHLGLRVRRACTGLTWGIAATWAGFLFVGWRSPMPDGFADTWRSSWTGFPIPGVHRWWQEFPPGTASASHSFGGPRGCFELDDPAWVVLLVNAGLLSWLGIRLARRWSGRGLQRLLLAGGVAAVMCAWGAMIRLGDTSAPW